jgi:hypothetical protein
MREPAITEAQQEAERIVYKKLRFHDKTTFPGVLHDDGNCFGCREEAELIQLLTDALLAAESRGEARGRQLQRDADAKIAEQYEEAAIKINDAVYGLEREYWTSHIASAIRHAPEAGG